MGGRRGETGATERRRLLVASGLTILVALLQVTLHAHAAREEGHISALVCTLNPKTGETIKAKPRWVGAIPGVQGGSY